MFIAHIPAGYIISHWHQSQHPSPPSANLLALTTFATLLGSVLPDFDLFYFYLLDARQHNHHSYFPHLPAFWLIFLLPLLITFKHLKKRNLLFITQGFALGILSHLLLDSIAGGIAWLHPFSDQLYTLVKIPRLKGWWVWSFFLHWTFLLELGICFWSIRLFIKGEKYRRLQSQSFAIKPTN